MASTNIGKAYIQIIPTTEGFKAKLQSAIDSDTGGVAEESGKKFGSSFGTYMSAGLKIAGAAVISSMTAIVSACAKISKAVIQNYAEYEQLVGGVETIFGAGGLSLEEYAEKAGLTVEQASGKYNELISAQDKVVENANNAWMTSGVSANTYMQQVTSFSASLLQSLDGDTNKAVDYANRAMIDMADNANKYGTDIGMLQNAYQGFSKQNFQMLDNLKLGYGGTKTEMERLISDASKLTDVQAELGITVEDGNMSFGNMINAISVMQTKMGIAGTTQREATETIQGSIQALSASWENLITGLGNTEADVKQLTQNVVTAFENVVKNVTPIIQAIADALPIVFSAIGEMLPNLITTLLPALIQAFIALVEAFITNLPSIFPAIVEAILMLVDMIVNNIGTIVEMLIELLVAIIVAIAENIDEILPALIKGIITAIIAIAKHLPEILVAIGKLLIGIFEGMLNLIVEGAEWIFQNVLKPIGEFFAELWEDIVIWFEELIDSIVGWFVDIWESISTWFEETITNIAEFFKGLWTTVSTWFTDLISSIGKWFSDIWTTIKTWFAERIEAVGKFVSDIWTTISTWFSELPSKIWESLKTAWTTVTTWASEKLTAVWNWAKDIVSGIWNGIKDKAEWIKEKISGWVDDVLGWFKKLFGIKSPSTVFAGYGRYLGEGLAIGIDDSINVVVDSINDMGIAVDNEMSKVIEDVQNATLGMSTELPSQLTMATDISESVSGTAQLASTLSLQNADSNRLEQIINLLGAFFPTLLDTIDNLQVVLDSGATVGGLIGEIDRQLGNLNTLKERGAYV